MEKLKEQLCESCKHSDIEEEEIEGCIYYATYSCEGDHVHVEEIELDKETAE